MFIYIDEVDEHPFAKILASSALQSGFTSAAAAAAAPRAAAQAAYPMPRDEDARPCRAPARSHGSESSALIT